jgi:hypothetical protein
MNPSSKLPLLLLSLCLLLTSSAETVHVHVGQMEGVRVSKEATTQRVNSVVKYRPADCAREVQVGEHVVLEITVKNGEDLPDVLVNKATVHGVVGGDLTSDSLIEGLSEGIVGMCVGESRTIISPNSKGYADRSSLVRQPVLGESWDRVRRLVGLLYMEVNLVQLVSPSHYEIYDCFNRKHACAYAIIQDPAFDMVMIDQWGHTPLMAAINSGMFQAVALLLNSKPRSMPMSNYINMAKPSGHNALFYAVFQQDSAILKTLLKRGADPNAKLTDSGWTAMHFAAMNGYFYKSHLKMLLQYGGDPYSESHEGESILDAVEDSPAKSWRNKVIDMLNDAIDVLDEQDALEDARALEGIGGGGGGGGQEL